jgi:PKHD-type hydroxylase
MKSMVAFYPLRFAPEFCDQIIDLGMKLPKEAAAVGGIGNYDDTIRCGEVAWARPDNSDWNWVRHQIQMLLVQANAEVFDVDVRYLPALQFTTYHGHNKGHFYKHVDNFYNEAQGAYDRKLSCVVQLTDPSEYEGGELTFDFPNNTEAPDAHLMKQKGSIVVFPSLVHHEVSPVTSGTRRSLVAWMEGPHWR